MSKDNLWNLILSRYTEFKRNTEKRNTNLPFNINAIKDTRFADIDIHFSRTRFYLSISIYFRICQKYITFPSLLQNILFVIHKSHEYKFIGKERRVVFLYRRLQKIDDTSRWRNYWIYGEWKILYYTNHFILNDKQSLVLNRKVDGHNFDFTNATQIEEHNSLKEENTMKIW